jgi:membrane-associated phospholipid phosphatase
VEIVAFAGLWYLSLFLCHRFGVVFPSSSSPHSIPQTRNFEADDVNEPLISNPSDPSLQSPTEVHEEAAALPVYKLLLPYIPLGLAIFIAGTRYFDFRNHGFDVLAGAAVGSITAYMGFRLYHPLL